MREVRGSVVWWGFAVLAMGCGATARVAGRTGARDELVFAPFQILDAQGRGIGMTAEGVLSFAGEPTGRALATGIILDRDGAVTARLAEDGAIVDARGTVLGRIEADGSVQVEGRSVRFDEHGTLVGGDPGHVARLVTNEPRVRRLALLVMIAGLSTTGREDAHASDPAPEAASAPSTPPAPVALAEPLPQSIAASDRALIQRIMRTASPGVRYCYELHLQSDPDLRGRIVVRLLVDARGSVSEAVIGDTEIDNGELQGCILSVVTQLRFPHPDGGALQVSYPYMLQTDDGDAP